MHTRTRECGCLVNNYYMPKHLRTAKHLREMAGRENIEAVSHYQYMLLAHHLS